MWMPDPLLSNIPYFYTVLVTDDVSFTVLYLCIKLVKN